MLELNEDFWNARYLNRETGWDMRQPSPPLTQYADGIANKSIAVLIPGCGNAHEAKYLSENGFADITLVDISSVLVNELRNKYQDIPINIVHSDFFLHQGKYDLILEQTFFCAISPNRRKDYVRHAHGLLNKGGKIAGVLFNDNFGFDTHPPFKGTMQEYKNLFEPFFHIRIMELCYNSIAPRKGNELFIELERKEDVPE